MRSAPATLLALVLAAGTTGCSGDPSPDDGGADGLAARLGEALSADAVLEDGESPALADVAFADADGATVAQRYQDVVAGMLGAEVSVEVGELSGEDSRRTAELDWTWALAPTQTWTYETEVALVRDDSGDAEDGYAVEWRDAVVEPSLEEGEVLRRSSTTADRGDITGAAGSTLVTERPVQRYGIDKTLVAGQQAAASARTLAARVDVDPDAYVKQVKAAGPQAFVEAITYRRGEGPGPRSIAGITGARIIDDTLALAPTREFAAPLLGRVGPVTAEMVEEDPDTYAAGDVAGLSGLQSRYDDQLRGTPGLVIDAVTPAGEDGADGAERELFVVEPVAGRPLPTTLDARLQTEAERLLADVGPASALVALRPSDGAVLVAANGPGTGGQNLATYGQAAPGSTFKIASTLALLRSGMDPGTTVECPEEEVVDGKAFENYDDYPASALGSIPLRTAVAQSCNTAFVGQHDRLDDADLARAAGSLGLGIDHDLGFPAYFGQVPKPASETEAAADMIGQGKVLASPMAMAAVIASVQEGSTVLPELLPEHDVPAPAGEPTALRREEARQLRAMLRETVTSGSGRGLADVPGPPVIAKTGTAEFATGDGGIGLHAWMVAAQGDLAVAVYVDRGESGSRTAGPILEEFLRAAG